MKKILLLITGIVLFAANLINIDFFTHKSFVDVLISLDSKFKGKIVKINKNEYEITEVKANREIIKHFENSFLKEFKITPKKNSILLFVKASNNAKISFSLTPEGYGIRMRVLVPVKKDEVNTFLAQNPEKNIDYVTYVLVLAILLILAIILWIVKKRAPKLPINKKDLSMGVVIQKPIDAKNKIVLFEFNKRKYLMLIGNTNILLDVFDENMVNISSAKEFEEFLKINSKVDEIKKYIQNAEELKEFDERI